MQGELGLRERKKRERRQRIEAVAIDRFEANGFDATTIDDIAAAADIAPRTFFAYFPTKEDVVLADYADRLERTTNELARRPPAEPPLAGAEHLVRNGRRRLRGRTRPAHPPLRDMAVNPSVQARSLQLQAGWESAVADVLSRRSGAGADDVTPRLMAATALACMRSSISHWILTGHQEPLPDLVKASFDRLAGGLAAVPFTPTAG